MTLTVGSMFAGYAGIELALSSVLDVEPVWFAEFDAAPSRILAHHWPDVPNLGDVTKVDWTTVPKVDVITGGSPCQDLSHAGKRAGMTTGTRSNLWVEMREAIAQIRPRLVCWENVRGAGSAEAASSLEQCPRCVGDPRDRGPVLRALGRVLGDLSDLGYDSWWYGLRASDVGLAHGRFRFFLFATPADADLSGLEGRAEGGWGAGERPLGPGGLAPDLTLLPTPAVNDMGAAYTPEEWDAWTERMKSAHGNGNGHGKSLAIEAQRLLPTPRTSDTNGAGHHGTGGPDLRTVAALLPTPRATDGTKGGPNQRGSSGDLMLPSAVAQLLPTPRAGSSRTSRHAATTAYRRSAPSLEQVAEMSEGITPREIVGLEDQVQASWSQDWREYEAAIRRQEHATGRTAPPPTETGPKGKPRLSPRFVEWLMALPEGWVTDVPGISRNDMLKALGNGVVPAQCAAALRAFIHDTRQEAAA